MKGQQYKGFTHVSIPLLALALGQEVLFFCVYLKSLAPRDILT